MDVAVDIADCRPSENADLPPLDPDQDRFATIHDLETQYPRIAMEYKVLEQKLRCLQTPAPGQGGRIGVLEILQRTAKATETPSQRQLRHRQIEDIQFQLETYAVTLSQIVARHSRLLNY